MRHPCERWGRYGDLQRLVFLSVRDALHSPAHPDSKRQERRKQRDLARYGARVLKESRVTSCPVQKTNRRRELRDIQRRLQEEQKEFAKAIAARLLGRKVA